MTGLGFYMARLVWCQWMARFFGWHEHGGGGFDALTEMWAV